MCSKRLAAPSVLLFIIASGTGIIQPPPEDSFADSARRFISDFTNWDWKRDQYLRYTKDYPFGWPSFDCKVPAGDSEPTDAHHLSPWHFGVIGAIGDSLTAGRAAGAEILSEIASDFRGLSFATGGQHNLSTQATLSNIFGHFSPGLKGASIGTAKSDEALVAGFNLADSGAFATDLPRQAQELVSRIKAYPGTELDKEWKLINIFIGSNDLCKACLNETLYGAEQYATNIQKAIRYLKENLPKTYVNIVPPFHVEVLLETQPDNPFCVNLQRVSCRCLFEIPKQDFKELKRSFDDTLNAFNTSEFQTNSFAVAISSGVNVDNLATLGKSLNLAFIALDCFHFSQMAHDIVAKIIWSDLFKPVGSRFPIEWSTFQPQLWVCPPEDCPYLRTPLNSKNCSLSNEQTTLMPKIRKVVYDRTAYLPSISELERRAFMEEHGFTFVLVTLGILVIFLATCVAMMRCCKKTPKPSYPNEKTRLLEASYEQQMF